MQIKENLAKLKAELIDLVKEGSTVADALRTLEINEDRYRQWRFNDPEFKEKLDEVRANNEEEIKELRFDAYEEEARAYQEKINRALMNAGVDIETFELPIHEAACHIAIHNILKQLIISEGCRSTMLTNYFNSKKQLREDFAILGLTLDAKKMSVGKDAFSELMEDFNAVR